jgi:prefoldin subunit 5
MAVQKPVLVISDKVRLELNQLLAELNQIEGEAEKQIGASVPQMDAVIGICQQCRSQIESFKAVNFPNKK